MRGRLKNHLARVEKLRFDVVVSRTCGGASFAERPAMRKSWAVLVLVVLGGCDLYFGGDDDPPPCDYGYGGAAPDYYQTVRDPYTGQCQDQYPNYPCDDYCGPCAYDTAAPQDWGACYSTC